MRNFLFSIIVPVFNRPEEIFELLESLSDQDYTHFEVIIIEDGSTVSSEMKVNAYTHRLKIQYHTFEKMGPSVARNRGMELATGDYFIFVDSDCLLPRDYLKKINENLNQTAVDVFGGSDRASGDFNRVQKAISYAMTSFFTTGGIRGGRKQVDRFYPRSFNMGISRIAYERTGGFPVTKMHPGEDMAFSIELNKRGFTSVCFPESFVYHKRRTRFLQFFKQVFKFGYTRYIISRVYPETFRLLYLFPSLFVVGFAALLVLSFAFHPAISIPLAAFLMLIYLDATIRLKSPWIGAISLWAALIQFGAYGCGFFLSWVRNGLLNRDEFGVIHEGFYPR